MSPQHFLPCVVLLLLTFLSRGALGEDEDDDIKGPIMPVKADGGLYATDELITYYKHKAEKHSVKTGDGYLLTVFRIVPQKQPASPVILQHGFLLSSDSWVTDPESLAMKLSDAGFDVWIGNSRGNAYSRSHEKLQPADKDFWNFSWHEMGSKDVPAFVDYVLLKTGQPSVHFIGYSMGTTMSYVMLSTLPEYNKKLKSLVSLAPVVYLEKMAEMVGPEGMAGQMASKYMSEFKESGKLEVFPRKDLATDPKSQITCGDVEESFQDMCTEKMEEGTKVLGGSYLPAGQSYKTLDHFYQMAAQGEMKYYKLDTAEDNKKAYGSETPPSYTEKFSLVTVPTLLWSTDADQLIVAKDIEDLKGKLPNVVANNRIENSECFDHIAFLFPRQKSCIPTRAKVYQEIIEAITKLDK